MRANVVRDYYDNLGESEWERLEKDAYHSLEWLTHIHFLEKYLPKKGVVLDAGGGPGRYAIFMSQRKLRVVLLDISRVQLAIARRNASETRVPAGLIDYIEGALPDLSRFSNACFDAVICFGPLSHLIDRNERESAIAELIRVVKPGAPIFISVINRYGVYRSILKKPSLQVELIRPDHRKTFEEGIHLGHPGKGPGMFTDAFFFRPEELKKAVEDRGVDVITMAACEGLAAHMGESLAELAKDKRKWKKWMDIHWQTCIDPHIIGISEHLLLVGRKKRR